MIQEKPLALCLVHSKLQTMAVSIHRGALPYTDVFLAGLILLPEKAAWKIRKALTQTRITIKYKNSGVKWLLRGSKLAMWPLESGLIFLGLLFSFYRKKII